MKMQNQQRIPFLSIFKKTAATVTFAVIAVFLLALPKPGQAENTEARNTTATASTVELKTLSAKHDSGELKIKINVPNDWIDREDLNQSAIIQSSNKAKNLFLIIISEPKSQFDKGTKLADYADVVSETYLQNMGASVRKKRTKITVNGQPALQYEFEKQMNKITGVTILYTVIEGPKGFHQVMDWTLKSYWDEQKPLLETITNSFKEE